MGAEVPSPEARGLLQAPPDTREMGSTRRERGTQPSPGPGEEMRHYLVHPMGHGASCSLQGMHRLPGIAAARALSRAARRVRGAQVPPVPSPACPQTPSVHGKGKGQAAAGMTAELPSAQAGSTSSRTRKIWAWGLQQPAKDPQPFPPENGPCPLAPAPPGETAPLPGPHHGQGPGSSAPDPWAGQLPLALPAQAQAQPWPGRRRHFSWQEQQKQELAQPRAQP